MVPLPGRAMPMASHRQFMLLAVYMPEQEPQDGQQLQVQSWLLYTSDNKTGIVNFCLNYGSHAELTDAMRAIAGEVQNGTLAPADINAVSYTHLDVYKRQV